MNNYQINEKHLSQIQAGFYTCYSVPSVVKKIGVHPSSF